MGVKLLVKCWCGHSFEDDFFNKRGHSEASKKILALQQVELLEAWQNPMLLASRKQKS